MLKPSSDWFKGSAGAPLHLYVHWPWCVKKCPYCDFNSHALPSGGLSVQQRNSYWQAVFADIAAWRDVLPPSRPIASIFLGGGTPSLITPTELEQLFKELQTLGPWMDTTEITLECNPFSLAEDYGRAYFNTMRALGVNRVSIGVQGLRDDWLQFLGRLHHAQGALAALDAAQKVFQRVNADVIYGLPGQALSEYVKLLETLASRGLSHIAAYQLTIERNTAFWGQVGRGEWTPVTCDVEADFFEATQSTLTALGYENYEISNFAKAGEACRHNLGVWRGEDYLGLGAGGHGRLTLAGGERLTTATRKVPTAYVEHAQGGWERFATLKRLNTAETLQEAIFTGLRLAEGVDIGTLQKTHSDKAWGEALCLETLGHLEAQQLLKRVVIGSQERMQLTSAGWSRLDLIQERLLRPLRPAGVQVKLLHAQD